MRSCTRTYRFRLRPDEETEQRLLRSAGARRWVYNWGLETQQAEYAKSGLMLSYAELSARLTALKREPETAWLREVGAQLLQQALVDLERGYRNFFERRAGFPRFHSRRSDRERFRLPQHVRVDQRDLSKARIWLPTIGWVRYRASQRIEGPIKSATIKRSAAGHWYVTLPVAFTMPSVPARLSKRSRVAGIDPGLASHATIFDGRGFETVAAQRFYRRGERKIQAASRALSKTRPDSRNRAKARRRLAVVHERVANQRRDWLHKLSSQLVEEYDAIFIEGTNVSGLARTKLAKSMMDAGLGEFSRQLEYKSEWSRVVFARTDTYFASTKTCSRCKERVDRLELKQRVWRCAGCGAEHDRDGNAAANMYWEGLREYAPELHDSLWRVTVAEGHPETRNARGSGRQTGQCPADRAIRRG